MTSNFCCKSEDNGMTSLKHSKGVKRSTGILFIYQKYLLKMKARNFHFLVWHVRSLGAVTTIPTIRKKLNKLKNNSF